MNKQLRIKQFRVLRESLKSYGNTQKFLSHAIKTPKIIGKNINNIEFRKGFDAKPSNERITKGHKFQLWIVTNFESEDLLNRWIYVITKDYRILYIKESSIRKPAADAWDVLTGVFYSHYEDGRPVYKSPEPTRAISIDWGDKYDDLEIPTVTVPEPEMNYEKCLKGKYWF